MTPNECNEHTEWNVRYPAAVQKRSWTYSAYIAFQANGKAPALLGLQHQVVENRRLQTRMRSDS